MLALSFEVRIDMMAFATRVEQPIVELMEKTMNWSVLGKALYEAKWQGDAELEAALGRSVTKTSFIAHLADVTGRSDSNLGSIEMMWEFWLQVKDFIERGADGSYAYTFYRPDTNEASPVNPDTIKLENIDNGIMTQIKKITTSNGMVDFRKAYELMMLAADKKLSRTDLVRRSKALSGQRAPIAMVDFEMTEGISEYLNTVNAETLDYLAQGKWLVSGGRGSAKQISGPYEMTSDDNLLLEAGIRVSAMVAEAITSPTLKLHAFQLCFADREYSQPADFERLEDIIAKYRDFFEKEATGADYHWVVVALPDPAAMIEKGTFVELEEGLARLSRKTGVGIIINTDNFPQPCYEVQGFSKRRKADAERRMRILDILVPKFIKSMKVNR